MTKKTAQMAHGLGNTKARAWCFTWNNYTEEDIKYLEETLFTSQYVIGREVGTNGTPHLQGYVKFPNAIHFESMRKMVKNNHVEKCKNGKASIAYCQKDGNFFSKGIKIERDIRKEILEEDYKDVEWKNWQKQILDIISTKPDKRTIYYIVDEIGGNGKTFLNKYICCSNENAIVASGKGADILHGIAEMECPEVILFDIPRCANSFISYGAIEKCKDGLFFSGKYENKMRIFKSPHVFLFMNQEPELDKMSMDRWKEIKIPNSKKDNIIDWVESEGE